MGKYKDNNISSVQQGSNEIIIEDNYKGKRNEGRVTISADLQTVIENVEENFKSLEFNVRYLSGRTMEVERDFNMEKPFQKIGTIEFDFFKYANHIVVYYKIANLLGLSIITLTLIVIYGGMAGIWLAEHVNSSDTMKVIAPFILFVIVFVYQRISNFRALKRIIHEVLSASAIS